MANDYGEPIRYDPKFKGPTENRSCTDILWLILFVLFLGAWGFVGYYGVQNGSITKLLAPIDTKGRRCGLDSGVTDKPYLVFFDIKKCLSPGTPITGCPTPQVCVKECPSVTIDFTSVSNILDVANHIVCTDDVDTSSLTHSQALQYISEEKCTSYVLKSEPVLYRCIGDLSTWQCKDTSKTSLGPTRATASENCIRDPTTARQQLLNRATALDSYVGWIAASWVTFFTRDDRNLHVLAAEIVDDLVRSRWYMLGALVAVVFLCFLYILLLRWVIVPVVWSTIIALAGLLGFAIYLCYVNYKYYIDHPVSTFQTTNLKGYAQSIFAQSTTWLVLLIILTVFVLFYILIIIFLRSRITIAIALIQEGSKAVCAVKSTVVFPIFPWILECAIIAYGVIILMYLLSLGDTSFQVANMSNDTDCNCRNRYSDGDHCDPLEFVTTCFQGSALSGAIKVRPCSMAICHFTGFESGKMIYLMHLVNLLGFFWALFFISGVADMMLASTFSTWYWTIDKSRDLPFFTLTAGVYRTLRYHLGTVAFGAFIIAVIRVIRVILEYIDHKVKKFDNPLTRCILCFCKCCFWCLECFMKFINKNAYIMCAVHGKNFCRSARDAFSLLMRNIIRVVVLDKVADFIFFLSKLLISIGVGFAVYYMLEWKFVYEVTRGERLHHNYVPAIILSVATYLVSTIFFNVYSMAVDTLFLCFLEDCERNDGSPQKRYLMSKNLMKILGKKNKRQ